MVHTASTQKICSQLFITFKFRRMKKLSHIGTPLSKAEQKLVSGGFWGCQPQIIQCFSNQDCPFCSSGCGIVVPLPDGSTTTLDICAF